MSVRQARLCIAACSLLWTSRAPAGEADPRERSVALFQEGVTAGKAADYARAEAAFRASYALRPSASTLRNWALTEMHLGKMVEALGHLKVALRSPGWTAEQRSIVEQNFDDAYRATGHLAVRTTDAARVSIDGVLVEGAAPFDGPLDVLPGSRRVEARLAAQVANAQVDALSGQVVQVDLPVAVARLEPPGPSSALARTSARREWVGAHAPGEPSRITTWWTAPHVGAVGLAAAGAVGLGLGLYFDARSSGAASDAGSLRSALAGQCIGAAAAPGCAVLRDKIAEVHTDATIADVALAAGATAAVGAAVMLALAGCERGGSHRIGAMDSNDRAGGGRRCRVFLREAAGDARPSLAVHRGVGGSGGLQPVGRQLLLAGVARVQRVRCLCG